MPQLSDQRKGSDGSNKNVSDDAQFQQTSIVALDLIPIKVEGLQHVKSIGQKHGRASRR